MKKISDKNLTWILILVLAVIWGSSFILIKRGLVAYTPLQVGAIRIFVSFLCVFPFVAGSFTVIEKSKWKFLLLTGLLGNGIPAVLFPLAQTNISSAVAGMINTMTPLFTFVVGLSLFGMIAGRNKIAGLLIGLAGALILINTRSSPGPGLDGNPLYSWYIVLATVCYAFSVNILRYKLTEIGSVRNTGFALMFAGIPMGLLLFSTDFLWRLQHLPGAGMSLFYVVLLGVLSTALSTVLFNELIKIAGALTASSVTYLIPIVATLWGLVENEEFNLLHILGLSAILIGVYLINKK
ncbi:MAG: EamA family transporter [Bacteroidetes bacterium]|nr:MAG: EamA family transporter [Bacteroidota bacterium]REK04972.1 MAG: EamA family transporter [Bacteroidota bacterium]REK36524.1 MAG: EamA family transporter [Bacteroidota bacterium]REK50890.1 MAG: EamA family transporter [Bacteroidota bacterium]